MTRIGVTMGDREGIGPEVTTKALQSLRGRCQFVIYGPPDLYGEFVGAEFVPPTGSNPALAAIEASARDLRSGTIDGVVTAPVNKSVFQGRHPGHTEFFAEYLEADDVAMMMFGERLKTVPVTTHMALRDVPGALSVDLYVRQGTILHEALKHDFGLLQPSIAIAGLNPHAGDGGLFGDEEETILKPAIRAMRAQGLNVSEPISPDTVFHHAAHGRYDAVLCAYHDQALIPFKLLHFSDGVNVTLGLGVPRTSPDHGPALDIAGQGLADPSSMTEAVKLAIALAEKRACK